MSGDWLKILAVALLCAVAAVIQKQIKGELLPFLRIGAIVLIFVMLMPIVSDMFEELGTLLAVDGIYDYAQVMLKAFGIAFLTRICSDICRDCGEGSIASGVESAGNIVIALLCIPSIIDLIGYASDILEMK